ncbi:MAG TPA: TRAP transporter small permease [Rhabdaerophilum sp.]|nr:TRAP transporter small permease [Rhabdaerophilum sp.]
MSEFYIRIEDAVSKLLLAIITLLVFVAAMARTLGDPMIWSVDLAQLLFVWLCFLGANRAMRIKAHIGVDFFVRKLPLTPRWLLEIVLGLLTLGFLMTLAYTGYKLTLLNWQRVYGDSGISYAWVTGAVPVGCALLSVTVLINLVRAIRDRKLVFYADKASEVDRSETQLG